MNGFFEGLMSLGFWQWIGLIMLVEAVSGVLRGLFARSKR